MHWTTAVGLPVGASAPNLEIGKALAPTGKLRVAVFAGSPLSLVRVAKTGEMHGISFDLGKELARRLGLPFEQVTYGRVAEVLERMKAARRP